MKTIKPLRLTVMPRPFRWRGQLGLSITTAVLLKKQAQKYVVQPDLFLYRDVLPQLDADGILDQVMPKPNPEFLVSGNAYTTHQQDKTKCAVHVKVAGLEKIAIVFGDRYWHDGAASEPIAFDSKPVIWANAYGGSTCAKNPLGKGIDRVQLPDGDRAILLPNVEAPDDHFRSPGRNITPLSFGPIRLEWPQRFDKIGSYDQEWLESVGEGFHDDMDSTIFNSAADDQIWKEKNHLSMDEPFEIWNMHPEQHCWSGALPALKSRCFIRRAASQSDEIEELEMKPHTVWFVPHLDNIILMFNGVTTISEDDAVDVHTIMPALEKIGSPRSMEHYREIFKIRSDFDTAALHALKDEELIPPDLLDPWIEQLSLNESHEILSKVHRSLGGAPDAVSPFVGPTKPLLLSELPEIVERSEKLRKDLQEEDEKGWEKQQNLINTSEHIDAENRKLLNEAIEKINNPESAPNNEIKIPIKGPPTLSSMNRMAGTGENSSGLSREVAASKKMVDNDELSSLAKSSLRTNYLYSAQYQIPVDQLDQTASEHIRMRVKRRMQRDGNLRHMNLTGANLSGMDLRGADLTGAWMEAANLTDTNLENAILVKVVAARACFKNTILDRADFTEANISQAQFIEASLIAAQFESLASWNATTFYSCKANEIKMSNCQAEDVQFKNTSFSHSRIHFVDFTDTHFIGCDFSDVEIHKSTFDNAHLQDIQFMDSTLSSIVMLGCRLENVSFHTCQIAKGTFIQEMKVRQLHIDKSSLRECLFRGIEFSHCVFADSGFESCDFSEANFEQSTLRDISCPHSIFMRTNFDHIDMQRSNFMYANLRKSSFIGANLSGCNFFQADMSSTILDKDTKTDRAYVFRTKLAPKYPLQKYLKNRI